MKKSLKIRIQFILPNGLMFSNRVEFSQECIADGDLSVVNKKLESWAERIKELVRED